MLPNAKLAATVHAAYRYQLKVLLVHASPEKQSTSAGQSNILIIQLFNWSFNAVASEIFRLRRLGYRQIHVSPPHASNDAVWQWWGRYQTASHSAISGPLGNERDFDAMLAAAVANDMHIIVDVVSCNPCGPSGMLFGHPVSERPLAFASGLRMLRDLIVRGVGGFRFDGADRIPLEFFAWALPQLPGLPALAEVVSDDVRVLAPYLAMARLRLYDFALLSTMREAFAPGGDLRILRDPQRHGRALPSPGAVTFVRNHDVERGQANDRGIDEPAYRARFGVGWNERARVLDSTAVSLAHAYIFGRADGTPYILAGMENSANHARIDRHDDPLIAAGLAFRALCQPSAGRPEVWLIEEPETIAWQRGDDRLVLVNKARTRFAMDGLRTSLRPGRYCELMTGWPLQIGADGGIASWQAPARWAGLFTLEDAHASRTCHTDRQTTA